MRETKLKLNKTEVLLVRKKNGLRLAMDGVIHHGKEHVHSLEVFIDL